MYQRLYCQVMSIVSSAKPRTGATSNSSYTKAKEKEEKVPSKIMQVTCLSTHSPFRRSHEERCMAVGISVETPLSTLETEGWFQCW
jgi:hypothetical protein